MASTERWARRAVAALAVFALLASGCAQDDAVLHGLVRDEPLDVSAVQLAEVAPEETSEPFRFVAAPDELLVVYFGYLSCPDVCPTTMIDLRAAVAELDAGDAARTAIAFVTVDPERDTADRLDEYLDHFFDRYHGLRPQTPDDLLAAEAAFAASSSVTTTEDGHVDVAHSATTYVVNETGTVLVEWTFGTTSDAMADDLHLLFRRT